MRQYQASSAVAPVKGQRSSVRPISARIIELAKPHKALLTGGMIGLLGGSGINLLFPYLIREIFNGTLGLSLQNDLGMITVGLIALFLIQSIFFFVRHYCFQAAGYKVVAYLRQQLYRAMMQQDVSFFDSSRLGDLLSRLSSDTELLQRAATINISVALRYFLQAIGGTILMLCISVKLTLVILLVIPVFVLSAIFWGKRLKNFSRKMQHHLGLASAIAEETLGAVQTVRVFGGTSKESERYQGSIENSLSFGIARARFAAIFSSSMVFIMHSSIAVVLWYGGVLVINNSLSIGDLTAFVLYCMIVAVSFGFLSSIWEEFMHAVGAGERIFEVLDKTPTVAAPVSPTPLPERDAGSISFNKVTFAYPTRPDVKVLDNLTFEIEPGKTVAFVGPSGAGKSTIAALIPRFYDPQQGSISYCGIPITELDPSELCADTSMVAQDPQVFSISILENIRYGRIDASDEEVENAAKAANLHDFIVSLPESYNTHVGDKGIQLSGGQKQRLAIARALLKDPKFLILDEATSSLDSENEHLVQQALERLMKGRTTLVIAHRLSTVQYADKVIVIKNGCIVQEGTHQSLFNSQGLYKTLVEHQLL
jgi:ATP-binding cassette subfamily B protein